jgi:hypothetical protein
MTVGEILVQAHIANATSVQQQDTWLKSAENEENFT